jgi:hypothetical protein
MTSTPSATAVSIAATRSVKAHPASPKQPLYAAILARGAMPAMVSTPRSRPKIVGSTAALPPAVDAVWVP